jgi:hypothetical protein
MAVRHLLPALVATAALALTGCGSSGDGPRGAPATEVTVTAPSPSPTPKAAPPDKDKKAPNPATPAATVAPEVVVTTTSDAVSQQSLGGWQGVTLAGLKRLDARLVIDEQATLQRVRAACDAFSTGLFQAKAVELVRKKFSTRTLKLTQDQAEMVYQVILRDACYPMGS